MATKRGATKRTTIRKATAKAAPRTGGLSTTRRRAAKPPAAKRPAAAKRTAATRLAKVRTVTRVVDTFADERRRLERNKKIVLAFYYHLIGQKDFDAARRYMGATYTQHNPTAADGPDGIRAWIAEFKAAFPQHRYEVKHVIAEGEFVALHLHGQGGPSPGGEAVVDLFRVVDGKVVEHWDVIQPIPPQAENANSMF